MAEEEISEEAAGGGSQVVEEEISEEAEEEGSQWAEGETAN